MAQLALQFLALPPERRALAFAQTAARMAASSVMVEKDFWVCWLLGLLFADAELAPHLVFKGGTSLSKVYGVIDRFSEDIDLSLSPEFLGLPEAGAGRNQANKWMTRAEAACADAVRDRVAPGLDAAIQAVLGSREGGRRSLRE